MEVMFYEAVELIREWGLMGKRRAVGAGDLSLFVCCVVEIEVKASACGASFDLMSHPHGAGL